MGRNFKLPNDISAKWDMTKFLTSLMSKPNLLACKCANLVLSYLYPHSSLHSSQRVLCTMLFATALFTFNLEGFFLSLQISETSLLVLRGHLSRIRHRWSSQPNDYCFSIVFSIFLNITHFAEFSPLSHIIYPHSEICSLQLFFLSPLSSVLWISDVA